MVLSLCEMRGRGCEGVCVIEKERERETIIEMGMERDRKESDGS